MKQATMQQNKVMLEGNANILVDYFTELLDKDDVKVAFFGDDILKDVAANYEFDSALRQRGSKVQWDTITTLSAATDAPQEGGDGPKKDKAKKDSKKDAKKSHSGGPGKLRKNSSSKKKDNKDKAN